jgi:SAM-dependent methyltransferase
VGLEPDGASAAVARARVESAGGRLVVSDVDSYSPEVAFDAVCAFEVLEHLADDRAALVRWGRLLRPGGMMLLSVPAHQHRYGPWDEAVGHYRRYSREGLAEVLASAGFSDIHVRACGFPLGYLLEAVRNRAGRRLTIRSESPEEATVRSGRLLQPHAWMGALTAVLTLPFRLIQRPFGHTELGTGLVAVARLPSSP